MILQEPGIFGQQGAHHDLGLGLFMPARPEQSPGDPLGRQGAICFEEESVGSCPQVL